MCLRLTTASTRNDCSKRKRTRAAQPNDRVIRAGNRDSSTYTHLTLPTAPAVGGSHTLEEFIFVDDIPKRAALLAAILLAD